jgi:WD40 repeat protein
MSKTVWFELFFKHISLFIKLINKLNIIKVNVWESTNFSIRLKLDAHQHNVVACDFSPDSCLIVTVSWDTRVIVWNSMTGDILQQFK